MPRRPRRPMRLQTRMAYSFGTVWGERLETGVGEMGKGREKYLLVVTVGVGDYLGELSVGLIQQELVVLQVRLVRVVRLVRYVQVRDKGSRTLSSVYHIYYFYIVATGKKRLTVSQP
jgi:hypothetical protein